MKTHLLDKIRMNHPLDGKFTELLKVIVNRKIDEKICLVQIYLFI